MLKRGAQSVSIAGLLEAYKKRFRAPQGVVIKEVVAAYGAQGVVCVESDFAYTPNTKTVTIRVGGPKKTELYLRREMVLGILRGVLRPEDVPLYIV